MLVPAWLQQVAAQTAGTQAVVVQQTNVIDALAAAGNYDSFIELVGRAGAVDILRGAGPFTLLAPNNAAMALLPTTLREALNPTGTTGSNDERQNIDPVRLPAFVNMHIIQGSYGSTELSGRTTQMRTRNGNLVEVNGADPQNLQLRIVGDSGFGVGGLTVAPRTTTVASPILCSNGIVLPISAPLIQ